MSQNELIDVKIAISAVLDHFIRDAVEHGDCIDDLYRHLSVEILELAIRMHTGSDDCFLLMVKRSLALVRTGSIEQ